MSVGGVVTQKDANLGVGNNPFILNFEYISKQVV